MIWTSIAALLVNGRNHACPGCAATRNLNLRSILVHNFGDALSNIAIIVGAVIIQYTHATWIDPLLGLAIGLLVLYSSIGILRDSSHILLEGRPKCAGVEEVARAILTIENVYEVHDIHIWSLGGSHNALSCHARIPDMHMDQCEKILAAIRKKLAEGLSDRAQHRAARARRAARLFGLRHARTNAKKLN